MAAKQNASNCIGNDADCRAEKVSNAVRVGIVQSWNIRFDFLCGHRSNSKQWRDNNISSIEKHFCNRCHDNAKKKRHNICSCSKCHTCCKSARKCHSQQCSFYCGFISDLFRKRVYWTHLPSKRKDPPEIRRVGPSSQRLLLVSRVRY